ncbi:MAG TPA: hypothetical protein VG965_05070 [Patescibacteria group bacterium]|nr:hypothetical protein [Patescibacteria group bacterium]
MKNKWVLFVLIFALAAFFRLYKLDSVPPGLHIDELPFGYNAYSILTTGKDEFGVKMPMVLRAYDDFRPALLSYLIIPFIKLFGLNILSIRLPNVILSLISIYALYELTYLFVLLASEKTKTKLLKEKAKYIALSTIFLFAISPWNIYLSRIAIDTNVSFSLFLFGLLFLFKFLNSKLTKHLLFSLLFLFATFFSYNGIKLFLPEFLIATFFVFYKPLTLKKINITLLISFIVIISMFYLLVNKNSNGLMRLNSINYVAQSRDYIQNTTSKRIVYDDQNKDIIGSIFDNRRLSWIPYLATNYFVNINPSWLYTDDGTHYTYRIPGVGLFNFFEISILVAGLFFIIKSIKTKFLVFIFLWIGVSIIPAALTTDAPNASRIYQLLPPLLMIEGYGAYGILGWLGNLQNSQIKALLYSSFCLVLLISILWLYHSYFTLLPYEKSSTYNYGASSAMIYAKESAGKYKNIIVSRNGNLNFSYMYFLFFNKYNPGKYISSGGTKSGGFLVDHKIEKYLFTNPGLVFKNVSQKFDTPLDYKTNKQTLYVVDASDLPVDETAKRKYLDKFKTLRVFNLLNGDPAIYALTGKN